MDILACAARQVVGNDLRLAAMERVRSYRWSSLERGSLTVSVRADLVEIRLDGTRVVDAGVFAVSETGGEGEPIFRGRALFSTASETVEALPRDTHSHSWSSDDIYGQFLFHGPAFQSIRAVTGLSRNGIEAVTVHPAGYSGGEDAPAVMLDATGQLAACWLRQHDSRSFGAFPFQIDRYIPFRSVAAGDSAVCVGRATLDGAFLRGDFDFLGEDGERLMSVRGLSLRYFAFPERFARCLFRGGGYTPLSEIEATPGVVNASLRISDFGVLQEGGGVFGLALAHYLLTPAERASCAAGEGTEDLLRLIAVKEAASRWALERSGKTVLPSAVDASDENRIRIAENTGDGETPAITVVVSGDRITARAENPVSDRALAGALRP
jgi:hypothetical protein